MKVKSRAIEVIQFGKFCFFESRVRLLTKAEINKTDKNPTAIGKKR